MAIFPMASNSVKKLLTWKGLLWPPCPVLDYGPPKSSSGSALGNYSITNPNVEEGNKERTSSTKTTFLRSFSILNIFCHFQQSTMRQWDPSIADEFVFNSCSHYLLEI